MSASESKRGTERRLDSGTVTHWPGPLESKRSSQSSVSAVLPVPSKVAFSSGRQTLEVVCCNKAPASECVCLGHVP